MGFGTDFDEILDEVGASITIVRSPTNITGEHLLYKSNAQVTKPFVREFFMEGSVSYNTSLVAGDLIFFNDTSSYYLVMNISPDRFEDEIYRYSVVLYLCNVTISIRRPVEDNGEHSDYYITKTDWDVVVSSQKACLTSAFFGNSMNTEEEIGSLIISPQELYIPSSIGVKELDRVVVSLSERYRVESIIKRRYPAIDVCKLTEDTRIATTTTTTTTTSTTTTTAA